MRHNLADSCYTKRRRFKGTVGAGLDGWKGEHGKNVQFSNLPLFLKM